MRRRLKVLAVLLALSVPMAVPATAGAESEWLEELADPDFPTPIVMTEIRNLEDYGN